MDLEKGIYAAGGFLGGLISGIIAKVFPAYNDLVKENADLRKEIGELREQVSGLEDALRDNERS